MPKFLHTADWQIGRLFATFDPEHAPLLAEARIAAVETLAALATAQGVKKIGGMEFYDVHFSYIDLEDSVERFVMVPEQSSSQAVRWCQKDV